MSDLPEGPNPNPVGERLKAAREARGMSLDEVATKTRVPIRHLQHIEAGEWDALPATTYSVGFARSYATAIGLNGAEIGAELREQLGATQPKTMQQVYYEPADPARVPPRSLAIAAAIVAILLAVGYMVWRSGAVDETDVDPAEIAAVETPIGEAPAPPPAAPGQLSVAPGAAAAGAAGGPVVITATGEVWLRVYEANGERLMERILQAGERYEVPASARQPQLRTGRPNAIRVTVGNNVIPQLGPAEIAIEDVSLLPADLAARLRQPPPAAPVQQPPAR